MAEYSDPLALEHMLGFNGETKSSVQFHPVDKNIMISYTGCLLVISDVTNPHEQEFLRGHNEAITCLAISPSGQLIASGQVSTTRVPNSEATVIVWDYKTRQPVFRLMELHDGIQFSRNKVTHLAFSPDEKFLAGADDQHNGPKMCIWHTQTAQLANLRRLPVPDGAQFITWGEKMQGKGKLNKNASYSLLAATRGGPLRFLLEFDVYTMQYTISDKPFHLPSTGLARTFTTSAFAMHYDEKHPDGQPFLLAGSSAGELCVFSVDELVFRAAVPVSEGGGVLSIALAREENSTEPVKVYCGCGNGQLKLLQGGDLEWVCLSDTRLDGAIRSLTLSADQTELLAGSSTGNIYRLDARTLTNLGMDGQPARAPLLASHVKPITCLAFGGSSEWFVTASTSGTLRRWELSHYSVDYEIPPPVKTTDASAVVSAGCLAVKRDTVLSGWNDGTIRAFDAFSGQPLWDIVGAHKEGVSCIDLTPLYLVSGGYDGSVRVWSDGASRQLVGNFDEHKKKVTGLIVDYEKPSLIHSCGDDKQVVTVDLDQARRVTSHTVKEGALRSMAQLSTGEHELVTGDAAGVLKFWDCDEVEPVSLTTTWHPQDEPTKERRLTHVEVSPPLGDGSKGSDFLLACTASGDVQIWELAGTQARLASVGAAHSQEVTMARWSPDGRQVISVGTDACICVWNFYGLD